MDWSTVRHFTEAELACNCCEVCSMNEEFVRQIDELREQLGFALVVSSGYRCPTHNQRVSSTGPRGPHTTGCAVDVKVSGRKAYELIAKALELGFTGIGLDQTGNHAKRFVHLDTLDTDQARVPARHRPWIWTY